MKKRFFVGVLVVDIFCSYFSADLCMYVCMMNFQYLQQSPAAKGGKAAKQSDPPVELNRSGLSGQDLVDLVATLWQESEFISLEDSAHWADTSTVKALKKVFIINRFFPFHSCNMCYYTFREK